MTLGERPAEPEQRRCWVSWSGAANERFWASAVVWVGGLAEIMAR